MLLRPRINANQIPVNQAPGIREHSGTVQSAIIRHTANQLMALDNQNNDRLSSYKSKKVNLPDSSEENAILHNYIQTKQYKEWIATNAEASSSPIHYALSEFLSCECSFCGVSITIQMDIT